MELEDTFLDEQRQQGDAPADRLIGKLFEKGQQKTLYAILQRPSPEIGALSPEDEVVAFLLSKRKEPEWYDEERILKGQKVFETYGTEIMTLLGVMALPYCYAGSPGNKALYFSEKMRKSPGKRLADTAEFIIGVSPPGTLTEDAFGHIHINKTRLIHAIARYYVSRGEWDKSWGVPINQEDMAGTNLAFSYVIINGLRKSGHLLSDQQKENLIYLWRYIGYQLGIHEELLPASYLEAFRLNNAIKGRNFKDSHEGRELTRELIRYFRSIAPADQSGFVASQVRYYLGPKVSSYLGLKPEPWKDRVTRTANTFNELQNYLTSHKSSYRSMLRNYRQYQRQEQ